MKIVVIGGGSVGAHVAYRLQQQGAEVVLLEATTPGRGTSASSIAWLSEFPQRAWQEEPGKALLRTQVHGVMRELQDEVVGDAVHWVDTALWVTPEERAQFLAYAEKARAAGVDVEVIDGHAAMAREPELRIDGGETVFWERGTGWVDGPEIVARLIAALVAAGGEVRMGTHVAGFDLADDRVRAAIADDGSRIEADAFVNAAGSWGSHVAAMAGLAIPLNLVPGRLVYTQPFPEGRAPKVVINTPEWGGRPDPSGGYAIHYRGHSQTERHGENIASAEQVISEAAEVLPVLAGTAPARSSIGIRPIPPEGPIVGAVPWLGNLYFTLSHGGIGWAPMWGWMAAREILGGEDVPELSAMRPTRFYLAGDGLGRFADDAEQQRRRAAPHI